MGLNDKTSLRFKQFQVEDAVCGMRLNPHATVYRALMGGEIFHFCSEECQKEFERVPRKLRDRPAA